MDPSENLNTIQDLEAEIDRTKAAIQDLIDLQISLSSLHNSKLPISNLPSKICLSIFSLACYKGPLDSRRAALTPFIIGSVCHTWRVIARSAPELWSSVSLCLQNLSRNGSMIQAELLDQWLSLSKALPLSISITFGNDVYTGTPESPNPVISVAASYSHQWESLVLVLPPYFFKTLQHTIGPIPNLESLSLKLRLLDNASALAAMTLLSPRQMFPDAPKLRTVHLDCAKVHVELPYHRLEELTLWEYKTTSCLDLLAKCSNLKFFRTIGHRSSLGLLSFWAAPLHHSRTVHLSKLVSLEIAHSDPSYPTQVLDYIVAPALESITISLPGASQIDAFSTFLLRSNVVLQRLSIIDTMPEEEELLKLLDTLPHLSHLEVNLRAICMKPGMWLSQKFLDYLRIPGALPALTSFKYQGPTTFQFRDSYGDEQNKRAELEILETMLLSRWNSFNGVSQLQSFSMSNISPPITMLYDMPIVQPASARIEEIEQSHVVRGLRKEGMHLVFMLEENS